ncbi:hypothetical protein D3Z38_18915 [Clostridiales bacterium]|nr:hypothetical protein [Clostridiales bacterium]
MTQEEVSRIKSEIRTLQEKLDKEHPKWSLAQLCEKKPYTAIRTRENGEPYFSGMRTDEWNAMRAMAKCLFLEDRRIDNKYGCVTRNPKKVRDMTPEQQRVAARFLDEVVEIFNRYFVENNKDIILNGEPYEVTEVEE